VDKGGGRMNKRWMILGIAFILIPLVFLVGKEKERFIYVGDKDISPSGITIDKEGNLYITTDDHQVKNSPLREDSSSNLEEKGKAKENSSSL
jgi:hypothetical protein